MPGIQDFITLASRNLNISEDKARTATGGILDVVKSGAAPADFTALLGALPGASALVGASKPGVTSPSGGTGGAGGALSALSGGAMGAVGGVVGGKAGGALELLGTLKSSGLSVAQGGDFTKLFFNFVKEKAGAGLVGNLTSKMPELAKYVT